MKQIKLCCLLLFISFGAFSQQFLRPQDWKKYKKEVFFSTGTANFLGDLGGRPKQGTDYSPADLNFNQTRTAFGVGARYRITKKISVAGKLDYLVVKGDDASGDKYRKARNLNFKSNIFEFSARVEAGFQRTKKGGGHYGVQRNYAKYKNINQGIYGFIGIGVFYYNPKGKIPGTNNYVELRPLHTEGQGLPGGPKQYSRFSVCIPVGVFYKVTIKKKWSFGAEFCYRKTFTDYIDDVGGSYYDPVKLTNAYGPLSAQMSNPYKPDASLGQKISDTYPAADGTPAQRGDKQKDVYLSLQVTLGYTFKKAKKSARLRSKF